MTLPPAPPRAGTFYMGGGALEVTRVHLGHDDGGELVRNLYGHPDAAIARNLTREGFAGVGRTVTR